MPDEKLDLQERMKNIRNGNMWIYIKYVSLNFFDIYYIYIYMSLKEK